MPGQLYKLDSCYGNSQQLQGLLQKLKDAGIDPLADIVINHRYVYQGWMQGAFWFGGGCAHSVCPSLRGREDGSKIVRVSGSACHTAFCVALESGGCWPRSGSCQVC